MPAVIPTLLAFLNCQHFFFSTQRNQIAVILLQNIIPTANRGAKSILIKKPFVTYSSALTCPSQLGRETSANERTEGGAEGGGAGLYKGSVCDV